MKTALQELIERLEEKIKICSSNNLEREAMGMIEAKAIATELLEKDREQNNWDLDNVFELGASAFQDCLNPHTLEFDHETFKRLKEEVDSLPQGDLQGDVVSVFIAILMTFAFWRIAIEHVEIITRFQ
jgi:hypothetical protein